MTLAYGSVCSGIEAATVAWHPLGWKPAFFSEIDKFPSAVLAHHYPDVPNHGDMTKFKEWPDAKLDVLVGGTPCQSFSIAGLRKGLDDPRGNLMLTYLAIAARYRPTWLVWENVPGVLSSNEGKDFGTFLGGLGELGYGFAYRVLDAQYFGVPQRRRRVFVVGYLGDWRRAAAVLFERQSLQGNTPPRRKTGQEITGTIGARTTAGGGFGGDFETAGGLQVFASTGEISHCLNAGGEGFDASEDGTGRGTPLVPITYTMDINKSANEGSSQGIQVEHSNNLRTENVPAVIRGIEVRRLTPRECERLMGFPDDYTLIPSYNNKRTGIFGGNKGVADGPRYRALGNSMAVPCMSWIGKRIDTISKLASSSIEVAA